MSKNLSPGVEFLSKLLLRVVAYASGAVVLQRLSVHAGLPIPMWTFALASSVAFPLLFLATASWEERAHEKEAASLGARTAPLISGKWPGGLDLVMRLIKNMEGYPFNEFKTFLKQTEGVFRLRMLWEDSVFTTCPEHIQRVLVTDFNSYEKGADFRHTSNSVLGSGIFNSDGDMWKLHRGMTRPFFSRERVSDFELFDRYSTHTIRKWKQRAKEGYSVDVQDLMYRFTLDSTTDFLFGKCVDSLTVSLPYAHNVTVTTTKVSEPTTARARAADGFAAAFGQAQKRVAARYVKGNFWPLFEIFGDKTVDSMKTVNAYLEPIVQGAVGKHKAGGVRHGGEGEEDETVLDHLVKLTTDAAILRDETLNILIAGRDTTAATLTFVIHFLAKYPKVMERLRDEVLTQVGPSRAPTPMDINDMKYLKAVISETLRLYPVVPANVRASIKPTTWPSPNPEVDPTPIYIPKNTRIIYSVFLMHRRTDLWGPDAMEFDPDRWLDERYAKYVLARPGIFLPFNAGPRICLGKQFAYTGMSFLLSRLMQHFSSFSLDLSASPPPYRVPAEWKKEEGRQALDDIYPKISITMNVGGGLWVRTTESESVK